MKLRFTLQIRGGSTLILGGGRLTLTSKSEVEIYLADPGWIDTDPGGGGVDRHSL